MFGTLKRDRLTISINNYTRNLLLHLSQDQKGRSPSGHLWSDRWNSLKCLSAPWKVGVVRLKAQKPAHCRCETVGRLQSAGKLGQTISFLSFLIYHWLMLPVSEGHFAPRAIICRCTLNLLISRVVFLSQLTCRH